MASETIREPYELLIRWKAGVISGLHKCELITVKDGDVVLSVSEGRAMPLEVEDVPAFFPDTEAVANVSRLLAEKANLESRVLDLEGQIDEATALITDLRRQLAEAEVTP